LTFCLTSSGEFFLSVNRRPAESHLSSSSSLDGGGDQDESANGFRPKRGLPVDKKLWGILDVYGNSRSLEFFTEGGYIYSTPFFLFFVNEM
jgi:hypothetical protein